LEVPSYLIDDAKAFDTKWLDGVETVGITAGASAPEALVQELISLLSELGNVEFVDFDGIQEDVSFKLPSELQGVAA
jgi:4-hydroxy-3-methylbut-2-enyl diphosphate reductase